MRYLVPVLLSIIVVYGVCIAGENDADKQAIEECVLDYLEGWYEGDAARMEKALHPDLTKRGMRAMRSGKMSLTYASKSNMVAYTEEGFGKLPAEERDITVKILDVDHEMAAVKAVSVKFIDYCQLGKFEGEWKIVNVLWTPVE